MSNPCALIVDDDRPIRALLSATLKRHGIVCDDAADGDIAIERLRTTTYSVVLLDLMMPKVNGFEVMAYMHENDVRSAVIVLSAGSQAVLDKVDHDRVVQIFRKPFDINSVTIQVLESCGLPVPDKLRELVATRRSED